MATNSIHSHIRVKDKAFGRSLINALNDERPSKRREVTNSKKVRTLSKNDIKEIFDK